MTYTNRLAWEAIRSRNSTTFNGTFQTLGDPLANPSYICKLVNNSNQLVTISIDGSTVIDVAPANSFWLYDESKVGLSSAHPALPAGTQFHVNGAAGEGNTGSVYLVTQYIIQG